MVQLRLYDTIERQSEMGYEWVFIGSFLTHSNYPPIYLLAPTRLYPTLTRPYQTLIDPNPTLSDPTRPPKITKTRGVSAAGFILLFYAFENCSG